MLGQDVEFVTINLRLHLRRITVVNHRGTPTSARGHIAVFLEAVALEPEAEQRVLGLREFIELNTAKLECLRGLRRDLLAD